jgi:propane monooxygenase large subunit
VKDLGFVRSDGKTLVPQPHLDFDDKKMWTLDHVRGYQIRSPRSDIRAMKPQQREKHIAEYRKGFTMKSV